MGRGRHRPPWHESAAPQSVSLAQPSTHALLMHHEPARQSALRWQVGGFVVPPSVVPVPPPVTPEPPPVTPLPPPVTAEPPPVTPSPPPVTPEPPPVEPLPPPVLPLPPPVVPASTVVLSAAQKPLTQTVPEPQAELSVQGRMQKPLMHVSRPH